MPLLRENPEDFFALINAAATDISYPPGWIEKDYWITEILRSLAQQCDGFDVIFKGGTSLSKAWRLIQRMSQDVDVLIAPKAASSTGARDKWLKAVSESAGSSVGIKPQLKTSSTGVHRAVTIAYEPTFKDPTVPPDVLVEMGVRGGPDPNERREIRSFIAEYAVSKAGAATSDFEEFAPFEIRCLRPERTLTEKLEALHHLASIAMQSPEVKLGTSMRHYYDIAMLLDSENVRRALEGDTVAAIAADVEERSAVAGWSYTVRPADGFAASPAFSDAFTARADVQKAYDLVLDLVVGGPRPSLQEAVNAVRLAANRL